MVDILKKLPDQSHMKASKYLETAGQTVKRPLDKRVLLKNQYFGRSKKRIESVYRIYSDFSELSEIVRLKDMLMTFLWTHNV